MNPRTWKVQERPHDTEHEKQKVLPFMLKFVIESDLT